MKLRRQLLPHIFHTVRGESWMDKVDVIDANQGPGQSESLGPNSRFWKIYREEASKYDDDMIDAWNGSLDVLLIFAGLFSAVSTSFIVEGYKNLQPDYTEYSARLLYLSLSDPNRTAFMEASGPLSPNTFSASPLSKWTNGLWFVSLVLSLSTALVCILAKTWLIEYRFFFYGSASEWVHHTVYRYNGLTKWHVRAIISTLPVVLHLSLFLFFTGLVLFLVDLDSTIAICCGALSSLVFLLYVTSLVIPSWRPDCPYRTPLMHQIERMSKSISNSISNLFQFMATIRICLVEPQMDNSWLSRIRIDIARPESPIKPHKPGRLSAQAEASRERVAVEAGAPSLTAEAIYWIIRDSPHFESVATAVQAIGSFHPLSPEAQALKRFAVIPRVITHILARFPDIPVDGSALARVRISGEECPDYLDYMRTIQVLLSSQIATDEETEFALAMTKLEVERHYDEDDVNGDASLLIVCGLWMYYKHTPRVSFRRRILSFFAEENDLRTSLLFSPSSPIIPISPMTPAYPGTHAPVARFSWEVLSHALRCFAHSDSDMKIPALAFFAQALMDFIPQMKRDLVAVSSELRLLRDGLYDGTAPVEYPQAQASCDTILYALETWGSLLPTIVPVVPPPALRHITDFFVDLVHSFTSGRAEGAHAPEFLSYLASDSFRDISWSHSDLTSLHQALWSISRQSSPGSLEHLIPPVLNLLRFSAESPTFDGKPMFAFAHVVELWLPSITPPIAHIIANYFLATPDGRPWVNTCLESQPSLHLAYVGDLIARSMRACPKLSDNDDLVDNFFKSRFVDRMIQAIYSLNTEEAEDPEIIRGFSHTWLSALRNLVHLRADRPEWEHVRVAFTEHSPAQVFVHSSSYNWTTYIANSWLRDWLA